MSIKKQKDTVKKRNMMIRKRDSSDNSDKENPMTSSFDGETPELNCDLGVLNCILIDFIFYKIREFEKKCNLIFS